MQSARDFLILWNNQFPFDKLYRRKYNIGFGSKEHRELCQIDVFHDILEDKIFEEYVEEQREIMEMEKAYAEGKLTKEGVKSTVDEKLEDVFDSININDFNQEEDE